MLHNYDYTSSIRFAEEQVGSSLSLREIFQSSADLIEIRETVSKTSAVLKAVSGIISIIASCVTIWMMRRSHLGLSTTYHRLVLGLCISDLIYSSCFPLFNIVVPSDLDYIVWNARGNIASCNFQGLTITVGILCGLYYHCSVNIFYMAVVKYEWSDQYIQSNVEPFLHAFPILFSIIMGIIRFVNNNYNDIGYGTCRRPVYSPPHCTTFDNDVVPDGFDIPCWRGHTKQMKRLNLTTMFSIIIPLFVVFISLAIIYLAVLKQERKLSKYGIGSIRNVSSSSIVTNLSSLRHTTSSKKRSRSKSRSVMHKAVAFSLAYLASNSAFLILWLISGLDGSANPPLPRSLVYIYNVTDPLGGLYNFVVFIYPRVLSLKRSKKNKLSWYQAFIQALMSKGSKKRKGGGSRKSSARESSQTSMQNGSKNKTKNGSNFRHVSNMSNLSMLSRNTSTPFGVMKNSMLTEEKYEFRGITDSATSRRRVSFEIDMDTTSLAICDKSNKKPEDIEKAEVPDISQESFLPGSGKNQISSKLLSIVSPTSAQSSTDELQKVASYNASGEDISAEKNGCHAANVEEVAQSETGDTEQLKKRMSFVMELEKAEEYFGRNSLR